MPSDDVHDDARYLSGSPVRIAILRELRAEPLRPAELTEAVDATRTTIQRILSGFCERDWLVKRDATYHTTPTGERVHDAYERLLSELERSDRYGTFAADLERAGADFPAAGVRAGDLTVADHNDPLAAVERIVELLREGAGSDIRSVSPIVTRRYNEAATSTLDAGSRIELVIDDDVAAASETHFETATERALEHDAAQVYVATDSLGYGFFRYDDLACVIAHDERNNPRCVFESTDPEVREWADERFAELRSTARPLEAVIESG